ncbi:MAG: hypothetical protein ACLFM0_06140 [Spirochaetales bacterium]
MALLVLAWAYPHTVSPLPELPSETRDGVTYIPSVDAIAEPDALDSPAPQESDHARYDEFASALAAARESWESQRADSLPDALRESDQASFDGYVALFDDSDSRLGEVTVGALPRAAEVPFAVMPSDSERYEATVWSGMFEYAPLYLEVDGAVVVIDLGALYDLQLAADSDLPDTQEQNGQTAAAGFLPAAPVQAGVTRFDSFDETFIDVRARTLISFDDPSMEPSTVRVLLRPADDSVELAGLFVTRLSYPSGSSYSVHLEDTGDAGGVLREHMLSATSLTSHTTRYELSIGEHRFFRGRFVRSGSSATVWRETFPQTLVVAEEEAGLYDEPRGERLSEIAGETRVRAVEPWDRLDTRDGVDGMWYRVEIGDEQGWMWAPNLSFPDSDKE